MSNSSSRPRSRQVRERVGIDTASPVLSMMKSTPEWTPPEKTELTKRDYVAEVFDGILIMKQKKYPTEVICEFILQHGGPDIAPDTLNNYFWQESKKRRKEAKEQKRRKSSSLESVPSEARTNSTTHNTSVVAEPQKRHKSKQQREAPATTVSPEEISAIFDTIPGSDGSAEPQPIQQVDRTAQPVNDGFNNRLLDKKNL